MDKAIVATLALLLAGCSAPPEEADAGPDFSDLGLEATASTGVIRGVVVDEAIRPVGNATVALTPGDRVTVSNAEGRFGFEGLAPGTYFMSVARERYQPVQASTDVVAGVAEPPIVRVLMIALPGTAPYVEALSFNGFLTLGVAVFATSIGTTVFGPLSDALSDTSIWAVNFTEEPEWVQGELVWTHNQPAGGQLIWEMTRGCTNTHAGYRETTTSPALAYWNTTTIRELNSTNVDEDLDYDLLEDGLCYRFFGGPHPLCREPEGSLPVRTFGCGVTVQQKADAYAHHFYNFVPVEGWRFTKDGPPIVPDL
jgi:hypothetical protein